jgi:hypothetical protein
VESVHHVDDKRQGRRDLTHRPHAQKL